MARSSNDAAVADGTCVGTASSCAFTALRLLMVRYWIVKFIPPRLRASVLPPLPSRGMAVVPLLVSTYYRSFFQPCCS